MKLIVFRAPLELANDFRCSEKISFHTFIFCGVYFLSVRGKFQESSVKVITIRVFQNLDLFENLDF